MGVPRRLLWPDAAAMRAYVTRQVERGPALPGAGSRLVGDTVLHPPVRSALMRPGMELLGFIAAGLLPDRVREGYAIPWTGAHAAAHRTIRVTLRTLGPALPRRLRISPIHDLAVGFLRPGDGRRSFGRNADLREPVRVHPPAPSHHRPSQNPVGPPAAVLLLHQSHDPNPPCPPLPPRLGILPQPES